MLNFDFSIDDLNALYVYETKMSLLIRMAQTRAGAERLLEAQVMSILSQCDYLDTRPEADHAFIGKDPHFFVMSSYSHSVDQDTFLPSAIQRYHQLFMPAMQLLNAVVSSLGHRHTTATQQVCPFYIFFSNLITEITSGTQVFIRPQFHYFNFAEDRSRLCYDLDIGGDSPYCVVVHQRLCVGAQNGTGEQSIADYDYWSLMTLQASANSGFGTIHLGILGLSARCLATGKLVAQVVPQTELEVKMSQQYALGALALRSSNVFDNTVHCTGSGSQTRFDVQVKEKENLLRKVLVSYMGTASDFAGMRLRLSLLLSNISS